MAPGPEPFHLSIPETTLADLKARLAMTRFPDQAPGGPLDLTAPCIFRPAGQLTC